MLYRIISFLLPFALLGFVVGCSEESAPASPSDNPVLSAPSALSASAASSSQINLEWTDESDDETGFKVERAPGETNDFAQIAVVDANVTSYQNTGLETSTTYSYRVRAYNSWLNSEYSNKATAMTTAPEIPAAPSGLDAATVSSSQINLSWTDASDNETGFKVERAPGGTTSFEQIALVGAGVESYQNVGLNSATSYIYRVRAYNNNGDSGYSNTATATTLNVIPAAPTDLEATAVSSSQINLSWTDASYNEDGFKVERAPGGTTDFAEIAQVGAGVTSYESTALASATSYSYRVRAYNNGGDSPYSNTATATTVDVIPAAPTNLTATAASAFRIDLAWTDESGNETGFKVERSDAGGPFNQIAVLGANVTSYQSAGLSLDTYYSYRVRAYNSIGDSDYSNTASAKTMNFWLWITADYLGARSFTVHVVNVWNGTAGMCDGIVLYEKTGSGEFIEIANIEGEISHWEVPLFRLAAGIYSYRAAIWDGSGTICPLYPKYSNTAEWWVQ